MSLRRIILISCDALRWDVLGCGEDKRFWEHRGLSDLVRTPTLDALAASGVRCTQAVTPAPYTSSAHASLLTGLLPARHGCRGAFYRPMRDGVPTLPQVLKRHGFTTILSSDVRFFFDLLDVGRGFDHRFSREDTDLADALRSYREGRLLLLVHCMDTNNPYGYSDGEGMGETNAEYFRILQTLVDRYLDGREFPNDRPDKYYTWCTVKRRMIQVGAREEVIRLYLEGVVKFDGGRLRWLLQQLQQMGLLADALVILFGDHGEGDYEDDFTHSLGLIEDVIRIPLILSAPGVLPAGVRLDRPVSLVDVVPTVLDLLGLQAEPEVWTQGLDGESMLPALRGKALSPRATVTEVWRHLDGVLPFMESCKAAGVLEAPDYPCFLWQRAVRTPQAKYVLLGERIPAIDGSVEPARFDLRRLPADPRELAGEILLDLGTDREDRQDVVPILGGEIPGEIISTCRTVLTDAELPQGVCLPQTAEPTRLRVYLGCGDDRRAGYVNVDAFAEGADVRMDMANLGFTHASVDEIFSAHALEHLGKDEVPRVLAEIRRVLRPGGRLTLDLPNLEWCLRHWVSLPEAERWGWPLDTIFGLQTHPGEFHKTGFTASRIHALLGAAGFDRIEVLPYWSHGQDCLWIEAEIPGRPSGAGQLESRVSQPRLSVILLVRDEIDLIDAYLDNTLPYVDQLVIVEGGSTDGTLEQIQARRDPKIRLEVWPQDAPAYTAGWREPDRRNRALELATGDYVLKKDVDEFLIETDYARIREWMAADEDVLHALPRLNFWGGLERIRLNGAEDPYWWPDSQGNLWAKRLGLSYGPEPLHCRMVRTDGPLPPTVLHEDTPIFHYHWALGRRVKVNDLRWRDLVADPGQIPSALAGRAPDPASLDFARPHVVTREYRGPHPGAIVSWLGTPSENRREALIGDMAAYLHAPPHQVEKALATPAEARCWDEDVQAMIEEIRQWVRPDREEALQSLMALCETASPARILIYGCGIGEEALALARNGTTVTAMDRPLGSLRFARFRAERAQIAVSFLSDTGVFPAPESYDAVLALWPRNGDRSSEGIRRAATCVRMGGQLIVGPSIGVPRGGLPDERDEWVQGAQVGPWHVWRREENPAASVEAPAPPSQVYDKMFAERRTRMPEAFEMGFHREHFSVQSARQCPGLSGRILDLGCGTGEKALWILAALPNTRIVGLDPSAMALRVARAHRDNETPVDSSRFSLVQGEAGPMPFQPDTFDGCLLSHVLEHLLDHDALFHEIGRVLRPGGTVLIVVPRGKYHDDPTHSCHFEPEELVHHLARWMEEPTVRLSPDGKMIAAQGALRRELQAGRESAEADAEMARGDAALEGQDWAAACQAYIQVLTRDRTVARARSGLGLGLLALGEQGEGLAQLQEAVRLESSPDLVSNLACGFIHVGRLGEAERLLEGVLAVAPGHEAARTNLQHLRESLAASAAAPVEG